MSGYGLRRGRTICEIRERDGMMLRVARCGTIITIIGITL